MSKEKAVGTHEIGRVSEPVLALWRGLYSAVPNGTAAEEENYYTLQYKVWYPDRPRYTKFLRSKYACISQAS
jgi:hypothetical protein